MKTAPLLSDLTALEHTGIALVCCLVGWLCGDIYAGAAFGGALFVGREHAQAEYRHIERFDDHSRANMPWWGGLDWRVWNVASLLDWLCPAVAVVVVSLVAASLFHP